MVSTVPIELLKFNSNATLSLLERCSSMEELKQIHARMLKTGLGSDTFLTNKVLAISASPVTGNLAYAKAVFDRIPNPDTFTWNTMIMGLSSSEEPREAVHVYVRMLSEPNVAHNAYTFPFVLKAVARTPDALAETKQIHARVFKLGFGSEVFASNSLIRAYGMFGDMDSARLVFDCLPHRDVVSWNSMIDGLAKNGELDLAFELFSKMEDEIKNIVSWTTMVKCCLGAGLNKEALDLFYEMQACGIRPDNAALSSALTACAQLGALDQGAWIHAYIKKNGAEVDSILGCVLIDMYAKCGDLENAIEVFLELKGMKGKASVETWTAMIMGYGIHGRGKEALKLFREMENEGLEPNRITFTAVLTACSYSGLVDEGRLVFERMERVYGIRASMEHYGCMVDLLGRAGLLSEAKEVIDSMPLKPNAVIWGSMLNACRVHGNLELGKEIGEILVEVDLSHGGRHVHLASVYSAAGEWKEAVKVRRNMKNQGISKVRGCSAIVGPDGDFREFSAVSGPDSQTREIYNYSQQNGK